MKTNNKPTFTLATLLSVLVGFIGVGAHGEEAGPPGVLAAFACNFKDGKDMDDLRSVRDYYLREAEKAGVPTPEAYVWTRFKGGVPFDHIWFDLHADLADFAASSEAWRNGDMSKVDARFDELETCEANIATVRPIFMGGEAAPGSDSTFISSNACTLRHGVGPDDLADLEGHINGVLSGLDQFNSTAIFAATPVSDGTNRADVFIFGVNPSPSAWAASIAALNGAPGGPALGRHFNATLDCATSLWFAEQVVGGGE